MHDKVKNFFGYIADTYLHYFSTEMKDDELSNVIRHAGDKKEDYKKFFFGYLAIVCNNEYGRERIDKIRNMHSNEELINQSIIRVRDTAKFAKTIIERIESIPDEELKTILIKISRYVSLFTLLYFKNK